VANDRLAPESRASDPALEWMIFYEDHTTFSNLDGEAWRSPRGGVQAVVERAPHVGYIVHKKGDYYIYDPDWDFPYWRIMDQWGFAQHLLTPGLKCVLFGTYASNERFNEVAVAAEEFGQKTGWTLNELG